MIPGPGPQGAGGVPRIRRVHALPPASGRLPQRVVVAGAPGDLLTAFLQRLADALDVPLVPLADLSGPAEVAELAAFDGWVTTSENAWARSVLLPRADVLAQVQLEAATFGNRVRRTFRRMRSDAREPDLGWVDSAGIAHPHLTVLRLPDPQAVADWMSTVER